VKHNCLVGSDLSSRWGLWCTFDDQGTQSQYSVMRQRIGQPIKMDFHSRGNLYLSRVFEGPESAPPQQKTRWVDGGLAVRTAWVQLIVSQRLQSLSKSSEKHASAFIHDNVRGLKPALWFTIWLMPGPRSVFLYPPHPTLLVSASSAYLCRLSQTVLTTHRTT